MVTKQVPQGGLLIDSMRDFKRSISACNAGIPLSIEEDKEDHHYLVELP